MWYCLLSYLVEVKWKSLSWRQQAGLLPVYWCCSFNNSLGTNTVTVIELYLVLNGNSHVCLLCLLNTHPLKYLLYGTTLVLIPAKQHKQHCNVGANGNTSMLQTLRCHVTSSEKTFYTFRFLVRNSWTSWRQRIKSHVLRSALVAEWLLCMPCHPSVPGPSPAGDPCCMS